MSVCMKCLTSVVVIALIDMILLYTIRTSVNMRVYVCTSCIQTS